VWLLVAIPGKYDMKDMCEVETYNIIIGCPVHAVDGAWDTIDSWTITPRCPLSIFSYFFWLVSIGIASKKLSDNFDGCSAEKAPFFIELILCLDRC
jgi:hypothetical protein